MKNNDSAKKYDNNNGGKNPKNAQTTLFPPVEKKWNYMKTKHPQKTSKSEISRSF